MTIVTYAAGLELSRYLRRGDRIVMGQACGEPTTLVEALIAQGAGIGDLSAFIATSFSGLFTPDTTGSFALSSMGAIGSLRTMAAAGKLGIIPCHVGQIGSMITADIIGCDVAFVQVSSADDDGNHSFGLIADHVGAMVAKARVVIAEVNEQIPFVYGDALLPSSKIDVAVYVSRAPVEVAPAKISATDEAIARIVADYVEDGSVLQIGIGAVPDAMSRLLHDRKDLGVHSGMLGDGLVDLVEAGVVTNARKPIDTGVTINGALIGTRRLYDFARRNKAIRMCSADYTNNAAVHALIPQMVTINSALEVDLTGQVNAEQSACDLSRRYRRAGRLCPRRQPVAGWTLDHRPAGDGQGWVAQPHRRQSFGPGDDRSQRSRCHRYRIWCGGIEGSIARRAHPTADRHRASRLP